MKRLTRIQAFGGSAAFLALGAFGVWWYAHDPFRAVERYSTFDSTAYYRPTKGLFESPRRQRTMFLKGVEMAKVLEQAKRAYPQTEGWTWYTENFPESFLANRRNSVDRIPEAVSAATTVEDTIQVTEFVQVPKGEEQVVLRMRGSDAFVPYPVGPRRRQSREETDRPVPGFRDRFLNAG